VPRRLPLWIVLGALVLGGAPALRAGSETHSWQDVERVVAIGDVHGSLQPLRALLRGLDLIDEGESWSGGRQHLVLVGDLLDRGADDRAILDLVMRLRREAIDAGGRVHVVLGNHEVMNLMRDMRYVSRESYADFVEFERKRDRNKAHRRFMTAHHRPGMPASEVVEAFLDTYPPGYFGRLRAFDPDGVYGEFLLGLPSAIRIDDVVFVHGGLTDEVARLGLDELNRSVEQSLRSALAARAELEERIGPLIDRRQTIDRARELAARDGAGSGSARALLERLEDLPFASDGPFWYRGHSVENERIERWSFDRALAALDAEVLVIGHTPTAGGRITSRFAGRLYRTDVGMVYGRAPSALILDRGRPWVFDAETLAAMAPLAEPPRGEGWARKYEELPDADLERFLEGADLTECRVVEVEDRRPELCEVESRKLHLRAVFLDVREPREELDRGWVERRWEHEVAAYRLDRMLGFDLVPVTVTRDREERRGSLRIWIEPAIDLTFILEHEREDLIQGLETRIGEARLFQHLLAARERLDAAKMLLPLERRIFLGDHSKAFPVGIGEERMPPDGCDALGPRLELALRELDRPSLRAAVGELLQPDQIDAVLVRRDQILEQCSASRPVGE
jgi:hypothetical protein